MGWLLLAVRFPAVPSIPRGTVPPSVTLAPTKQSDHLFDLEPLFLPTEYNTSTLHVPLQVGREPNSIASNFPPKWTISETSGGLTFPEPIAVPASPVQVLSFGETPAPWPEVGRADIGVAVFKPRTAYIEIATAKTGQPVFSSEVPISVEVPVPAADWAPLEFLVAIDSTGLVGAPVITGSTTTEEVESFFRTFVARTFRLGARLTPGFYTVRIGP